LRKHLESLAAPRGKTGEDAAAIELLYLDQVKTHALVLFKNMTAASRVRAALHDSKFPKEASRDPLFVDFVPDNKVEAWMDKEKSTDGSGRTGGIRWHVVYTSNGDAIHEEIGAIGRAPPKGPRASLSAGQSYPPPAPLGLPRNAAPPPPRASGVNAAPLLPRQKASFQALEERFDKTTTKPMLYYKRVDPKLAASRLEELRYHTARGWSDKNRRVGEEMFRYHFEQGDKLVNTGLSRGSQFFTRKEYDLERKFEVEKEEKRKAEFRRTGGSLGK
jgi:hypothetical protein